MINSTRKSICLVALCILAITGISYGAVRIVAALPDHGSIAAYIGGDKVEVSSIAKANSNPHSVEVFPSYMAGCMLGLEISLRIDSAAGPFNYCNYVDGYGFVTQLLSQC